MGTDGLIFIISILSITLALEKQVSPVYRPA